MNTNQEPMPKSNGATFEGMCFTRGANASCFSAIVSHYNSGNQAMVPSQAPHNPSSTRQLESATDPKETLDVSYCFVSFRQRSIPACCTCARRPVSSRHEKPRSCGVLCHARPRSSRELSTTATPISKTC
jgi:hypothetical protein